MKTRFYLGLLLVGLLILVLGCGKVTNEEIGRLEVDKLSNEGLFVKELTFDLKKGEKIEFWTDMDVQFENNIDLAFIIELEKDTVVQGGIVLDPFKTSPTMNEFNSKIGSTTKKSFLGKMDFWEVEHDGKFKFKVILRSTPNPTLVVRKADFIFRK